MTARKQTGKLAGETLSRLLRQCAADADADPTVLVGPKVGLDAAAIAVEAGTLVLASDPVTYAVDQIGRYAVHVNANDIFVSGAEPRWMLADLLLPPGKANLAERILRQIRDACREIGNVSLIGGHTEMTPGLDRPIVAGFMIGIAPRGRVLTADLVRPGDVLIVTKGLAVEGTAVLAREFGKQLLTALPKATVSRAKRLLDRPGISVADEARIALSCGARAMHDPTEGGLLNGLWEMAAAAKVSLHVQPGAIPVLPETQAICEHFNIDPLKLLASGSLLIATAPRNAGKMLKALTAANIPAAKIGIAAKGPAAVHLGKRKVVRRSNTDDILKVMG